MDRNSLFATAVILAVSLGGAYYFKTSGQGFKGLDTIFAPKTSPAEDWKRDDPGWERLKADPPVEPSPPPTPPQADPAPQEKQPPQRRQPEQPRTQPPSGPG